MASFRKLLQKHNFKNSIRYWLYALLVLYFFSLLQIWRIHYNLSYGEILSSVFSYRGANLPKQKYILTWDNYYLLFNDGKQIFPHLQCPVNNCIFTKDRDLLDGDYTRFDAILFSEQCLKSRKVQQQPLPEKRSRSQLYIFTTIESSFNTPACELDKDDFFNWTFTYRLDSDVLWPYFFVRNVSRHIVAPSKHVQWVKYDRTAIPLDIQNVVRHRTKAAAWLVSHCQADSSRDDYLSRLQEHLFHFSLQIDVYGACSKIKCTNDNCNVMFKNNYFFYMAFENSFSVDYVSEKVLHGYNNYVVPIVYGGANYSRFLPPGSYLNARLLHPYNLAYIMYQTIKNPLMYYEFFKWTNYYTIDEASAVIHPLCDLCKALHNNRIQQQRYRNFRVWWNGRNGLKWCLPTEYWNETSLLRVDPTDILKMYTY